MYLWLEEMGLINEPKESKEDQIEQFEDYLKSVAARNKLTRRNRRVNVEKRGKAV